jgi:hypothetical protein
VWRGARAIIRGASQLPVKNGFEHAEVLWRQGSEYPDEEAGNQGRCRDEQAEVAP